ncbi:uncharacterized protein LOC113508745 [Trichoplusia ni]|uniref:Uncharacterized protein LOC113508745 n=1 Tax=Trichoplusia ni TaxID=7111 RepID=A0A7E5X4N9_TRINI|nr:uncharacterized protein LOC113508745 [Trichoplusia ni]
MSDSEINTYFAGNGTYKAINPIISKVGDFTPFYIAIAICSVIFGFLLILNIVCCCSRYSDYWLDRHTGNRWIVSIWSATPHKQPPLDFTELESNYSQVHYVHPYRDNSSDGRGDIPGHNIPSSISQQPLTSSQEYLELHKRESDI